MERSTRQRSAIRSVIDAAKRPLSPQEVLEGAQHEVAALGIATVYRSLKLMLEEGVVRAVTLPGVGPRYESVPHDHGAAGHHHHFQCTSCDRVFVVERCPGDLKRLAPRGFSVEHHELTLYGHCKECRQTAAATV